MRVYPLFAIAVTTVAAAVFPRDAPNQSIGVKTITSPNGSTIRYKEPGEEGVCETTPGVKSYSGYIDIAPDIHVLFWFFESKLFEELGPCTVADSMTTVLRDHPWTEVSNLLFLSQPVGTGFSYSTEEVGILDPTYMTVESTADKSEEGRWSVIDVTTIDNSRLAAESAWELLQGFYSVLPSLDADVESADFNLWHWLSRTESFGMEGLFYRFGDCGTYDITIWRGCSVPPSYWRAYLNTAPVQNALGVELNYKSSNLIYMAFSLSGDFAAPYLLDLEKLLELDIQISLVYGDADYICNWLGGEEISKVAKWSGQEAFNEAGYTNLMVDGKAYGETRQYGKLSFTRVWEAGHEVHSLYNHCSLSIDMGLNANSELS
ncbi:Alpha/Beta hydrolase protein [Aspergillus alliaceus]|uniref:Alpha/Beta hydrolase protein n=1 Tax=Petromyces alliaceus TaxID=209559 RepID=UPI0012A6A770|nr:Alpha/Beta hydrolase protein [Aspergillus alliaceus]KAB8232980.1 Alpha/Beta hydrolase protein [Aspergillus alliaceus]